MKKLTLTIICTILAIAVLAQAPQGISHQAVIRNANNQLVTESQIGIQVSIIQESPGGTVVFSETHTPTSNANGLISFIIGEGSVLSGVFAEIDWAAGSYFIKTEADPEGNHNYSISGISQILTVPYSKFSDQTGSLRAMTTEDRDAFTNPTLGMSIYNITTNCINYYNGIAWFELCGDCTPLPTQAYAGVDQYIDDETTSAVLSANIPEFGTGTWAVLIGIDGSFDDVNDPNTLFTGIPCETYTLLWTIANPCGETNDQVNIVFDAVPTPADAGEDILIASEILTVNLAANTPEVGTGLWSIVSGNGGSFENAFDPATQFTGHPCETYVLRWTISTDCHESHDEIVVDFNAIPTVADAGEDIFITDETTSVTLAANAPEIGVGIWTILSGSGGIIEEPANPASTFSGQPCETYILEWKISTACHESTSTVNVQFFHTPTQANAGENQFDLSGTWTTLAANTPESGTGEWNIIYGQGGQVVTPNNPASIFVGQSMNYYVLEWVISTECLVSRDTVAIAFGFTPTFLCGIATVSDVDGNIYNTVPIGNQCWMKENLKTTTYRNGTSIPNVTDAVAWSNLTSGAYAWFGNDINWKDTYGALYNWYAVNNSNSLCPTGWRVPSRPDWDALIAYVSSQPDFLCNNNNDYIAKALAATTSWFTSSNTCAVGNNLSTNNTTKFTALPGGSRQYNGTFIAIHQNGYWWGTTSSTSHAFRPRMLFIWAYVENDSFGFKSAGNSVRCLKD